MPLSSQLMNKLREELDSEDLGEEFDSVHWGEGTSKVVAQHYNTMHEKRIERAANTANDWKKKAAIDADASQYNKLNREDFVKLGEELQDTRNAKKHAKQAGSYVGLQRLSLIHI